MTRPSTFNQQMADLICDRIAQGESLRSICSGNDTPALSTVFKWLNEQHSFSDQYARARETQADTLADDILSIADDGRNDWMTDNAGDNPGWRENGEALKRSQVRIDARKWLAGKMRPKKYGDKLDLNHSGAIDISEAAADAKLAALLKEAGIDRGAGSSEAGETEE